MGRAGSLVIESGLHICKPGPLNYLCECIEKWPLQLEKGYSMLVKNIFFTCQVDFNRSSSSNEAFSAFVGSLLTI